MRHLLAAIVITTVLGAAGIVDHRWHQYHCLAAVRDAHLVSVGSHEFGLAEYSFRPFLAPSRLPDPRDVCVFFGPLGTVKLSKLLLWGAAAGVVAIGCRAATRHSTPSDVQEA